MSNPNSQRSAHVAASGRSQRFGRINPEIIATGLRARENPRPRKPSYPRKEKP